MFKAPLLLWKDVAMLLAILRVKTAFAFEGIRDWNEGLPDFCFGIPTVFRTYSGKLRGKLAWMVRTALIAGGLPWYQL